MNNIEQIYTGCLAQGAYFIYSEGEAAVIDPLRETGPYIERAKERGVEIKYIFETHFHADFVSGHLDLAKKTGAQIVFGPTAKTTFEKYEAKDGEEFKVGKLTIRVLHTPGHTPESTSYLLINEKGEQHAVFTGDTLFIGDVGRPDLAQKSGEVTIEDLAGWLYDSLRNKIMTLPDATIVYPAHGAGSACGKNMSSETWDTIGHQKKVNYALREDMTKEEFIREVTEGLMPPPVYFSKNAALNKQGYESIDTVMKRGAQALGPDEFNLILETEDVVVLDVRSKESFVEGFIPGSIFIGLDGSFAPWVGALVPDLKQKIVLVAPVGREKEAVKRLARVGFDHTLGYLKGGFESWKKGGYDVDQIKTISIDKLPEEIVGDSGRVVLDVRKPGEYEATHMPGAQSFPLDFINQHMHEIDRDNSYLLHCRSGYRSTIAASIIKARGYDQLINVHGNFDDLKERGARLEGNCPSLQSVN